MYKFMPLVGKYFVALVLYVYSSSAFTFDSYHESLLLNKEVQTILDSNRIQYQLPALSVSIKLPQEENTRNYVSGYYSLSEH